MLEKFINNSNCSVDTKVLGYSNYAFEAFKTISNVTIVFVLSSSCFLLRILVVAHCLFQPCIKWEFHCSTRLEYGFSSCMRFFLLLFFPFFRSFSRLALDILHLNILILALCLFNSIYGFILICICSFHIARRCHSATRYNAMNAISYIGIFLLLHQSDHLSQVLMNCCTQFNFHFHLGYDISFSTLHFLFARFLTDPFLIPINPYIRHWEAARFDVEPLKALHERRRRKRETVNGNDDNDDVHRNSTHTSNRVDDGLANAFNLSFYAHNR